MGSNDLHRLSGTTTILPLLFVEIPNGESQWLGIVAAFLLHGYADRPQNGNETFAERQTA